MNPLKFISIASAIGAAVPILSFCLWSILEWLPDLPKTISVFFTKGLVLFWPSSLALMGAAGMNKIQRLQLWILASGLNVILYSILGAIFWVGIFKFRPILPLLIIATLFAWYELLSI